MTCTVAPKVRPATDDHMGSGERGFTLLGLLFLIAGMGVAMAALGTMWHTVLQREKEQELLFVGDQYRRSIESFWNASPKGQERLPKNFKELIQDPRFPNTVRHLRRLYQDPMTGSVEWGLLKEEGGAISGVYSLSESVPMKEKGFPSRYAEFEGKRSYREWQFRFKNSKSDTAADKKESSENAPSPSIKGRIL